MDPKITEAKAKFKRLAVLENEEGEIVFAFRPANKAAVGHVQSKIAKDQKANDGKSGFDILSHFCGVLLVYGTSEDFKEFCNEYPLKIVDSEDGDLVSAIFEMARGNATVTVI